MGRNPGPDITDPATRRPRLLATMCETCIFRPGNPMGLRPGRLGDMIRTTMRRDSFIVCHATLPGMVGNPDGTGPSAACRGFRDRCAGSTNPLRIYDRLRAWVEIAPPKKGDRP